METDDSAATAAVKNEPLSQTSTTSSTPVPPTQSTGSQPTTTGASGTGTTAPLKSKQPAITLPEVDVYLHLLVLLFALDRKKYQQVFNAFLFLTPNINHFKLFLYQVDRSSRENNGKNRHPKQTILGFNSGQMLLFLRSRL